MPNIIGGRFAWALILLVVAVGAALFLPERAGSQPPPVSSWLKPEPPVFTTIKAVVPAESLPAYSYNDCSPRTKFITVPGILAKAQSEISYEACAVHTAYSQSGAGDGNIRLFDTNLAGPVKTFSGSAKLVSPIPNSSHVMYSDSSPVLYGAHRYLIKDFNKKIDTVAQPNGSVFHRLRPDITGTGIKNAAGELIAFSEPRFSENGKWMIADVHQRGMTRVNIETGETLVFGAPYNHGVGTYPKFVSAISGDGRYALVASYSYGIFQIYDLSVCMPNPDRTRQANCPSKNLLPAAVSHFSDFQGAYHAQFSTNHTLRLYVRYAPGIYGYFTLTAAGESESRLGYLAAGDSFASGEGAFNYKPGTDVRSPFNGCHLSLLSYPYLLAATSSLGNMQSVACSGARMKDIVNGNYSEEQTQAKSMNGAENDENIFSNFLPGYRPQISFVGANKPANLTISIGGNDIGFGKILTSCLAPGTCYTDPQERLNLVHTINSQYPELVSTFESLKQQAGTGARIYALGYPSFADPAGNCALNVRLDKHELELANQIAAHLNLVIKQAAQKAGLRYADIEKSLAGHRLCETNSAGVAVNGLTAGNDKTFSVPIGSGYSIDGYFTGQESYHPNQLGHRLMSKAVSAETYNFKLPSPAPATVADPPLPGGEEIIGTADRTMTARKIIFNESMADTGMVRDRTYKLRVEELQPGSKTVLQINSTPTTIGTYQASARGHVAAEFAVPPAISPGLHVLHLQAKNKAGEDIDIQKVVYVAHTLSDIDGDGIPNDREQCLLTEPSKIDFDGDETDDACDPLIGPEPVTVAPPDPVNEIATAQILLSPAVQQTSARHLQNALVATGLAGETPHLLGVSSFRDGGVLAEKQPAAGQKAAYKSRSDEPGKSSGKFAAKPWPVLAGTAILALLLVLLTVYLALNRWQKRP